MACEADARHSHKSKLSEELQDQFLHVNKKLDSLLEQEGKRLHRLEKTVEELHEEITTVRECLAEAGVISSQRVLARMHRRHFSAMQQAHPCGEHHTDKMLEVLQIFGAAAGVVRASGLPVIATLSAASPALAQHMLGVADPSKAVISVHLYVCGGKCVLGPEMAEGFLSSAERINLGTGAWEALPPMTQMRGHAAAAAVAGDVYVCGGLWHGMFLNSTERYQSKLGCWEVLEPMEFHRLGDTAVCAVLRGDLYIGGGHTAEGISDSMECLRIRSGLSWERQLPMEAARSGAGRAVLRRRLYVCGGSDDTNCLSSAECFDPDRGYWIQLPSMATRRANPSVASMAGSLYVCGGVSSTGVFLRSIECFRPEVGIWNGVAAMTMPRSDAKMAEIKGQIYIFGGRDREQPLQSVERFDPAAAQGMGHWEVLPPMADRRVGAASGSIAGHLYICGGWNGRAALQEVEHFDAVAGTWTRAAPMSAQRVGAAEALCLGC